MALPSSSSDLVVHVGAHSPPRSTIVQLSSLRAVAKVIKADGARKIISFKVIRSTRLLIEYIFTHRPCEGRQDPAVPMAT